MRKSTSRSRLICAGLTTGAVAAALLVSPPAAHAALTTPIGTVTPTAGAATGTITATETGFLTSLATATTGALFTTLATCPVNYTAVTASATAANATATKVSDDRATVPVPSALAVNNGAARRYILCIYNGTAGGSTLLGDAYYNVSPNITQSPVTGPSGGGNTITGTIVGTLPATVGAMFAPAGQCPAFYATGTNLTATSVVRTSATVATVGVPLGVAGSGTTATAYNLCLYNGNTNTTSPLFASAAAAYNVSLPAVTLSNIIGGPGNGATPINLTINSTTNFLTGYTTPAGLFTSGEKCPAVYSVATVGGVTPVAASVRKTANNRAGITVPSGVTALGTYQVCVYSDATSTGKLLATTAYTVTTMPTLTKVTPDAGPALGGATVTVTGTNFPTAANSIRLTLGGTAVPAADITPISDTSFTFVTPQHSVGNNVPLVMTTDTGSVVLSQAYDFVNAIKVSPNTAPNSTPAIDVFVQGVGFLGLNFAAVNAVVNTLSTNAHVFLVDGDYNPASALGTNSGNRGNGPLAECSAVLVISDTELICSLQLNQRRTAAGVFTMAAARTITDFGTTAGSNIIVSGGTAAFTVADIGVPIVESGNAAVPAGTTIVSVTSPTTAVMSADALTTDATVTADVGGALRTPTVGTTQNSATVTGTFTQADVGRVITGAEFTAGTTIVAVATNGSSATISQPSTATTNASASASIYAPSPVPNGAYTLTVVSNGALNAATADDTYSESVISSGSTFTVAPF